MNLNEDSYYYITARWRWAGYRRRRRRPWRLGCILQIPCNRRGQTIVVRQSRGGLSDESRGEGMWATLPRLSITRSLTSRSLGVEAQPHPQKLVVLVEPRTCAGIRVDPWTTASPPLIRILAISDAGVTTKLFSSGWWCNRCGRRTDAAAEGLEWRHPYADDSWRQRARDFLAAVAVRRDGRLMTAMHDSCSVPYGNRPHTGRLATCVYAQACVVSGDAPGPPRRRR